ncbi:MAG TPA: redoxin domain-containing protein [Polyangiaceae bacterium]
MRRLAAGLALLVASCTHGATDLDGSAVDPFAGNASATVLVFVGTACPVSNRYAPEIQRIHDDYASRGVRMYLVYPDKEDSAAIRDHLKAHALGVPALRDPGHVLVRRSGVSVTPEAAVFRGGAEVYHGRIDDRQVDLGVSRAEPSHHDLRDAIEAAISGKQPDETYAPAVGCSIPP